MNAKHFIFPALCLGGAALLLAPARPLRAFSKIGGSLSTDQRDVRLFNNFADAAANANVTPAPQFPGYDGAELAIWKSIVEWGSLAHGDGTGDSTQPVLGNGGANFDALWSGNANAIGSSNNNIVSTIASCGGGTLAFTETPISDGWRIRFCEDWTWDDGPGSVGGRFDIQSVMTHEYGHALGLGHSVSPATMQPSVAAGSTALRSIEADDIAGVKCVYGVASGTKPTIVASAASGGSLTVYGTNFSAINNEVWFTNVNVTANNVDPRVRVLGVSSSAGGTVVSVTIPANAGPGDVLVKNSGGGGSSLSNAFPTDLVGTFGTPPGTHPDLQGVSPSTIDALIPGTAHTITLSGTNLLLTTDVLLDGVPIAASRYTIVDDSTITLDMPQANTLGTHDLGVTDGVQSDNFTVLIVVPATPKYELGTGDALNVVDRDNGLPIILSGNVGGVHYIYASPSNLPSSNMFVSFDIGNNFTSMLSGGNFTIPAKGWFGITVPTASIPDPGILGMTWYSQVLVLDGTPKPFPVSNLQSIMIVQ